MFSYVDTVSIDEHCSVDTNSQRLYNVKNKVIALVDEELKEASAFRDVILFLKRSRIAYAISADPVIIMHHITYFWENADFNCVAEPPVLKSKIDYVLVQF
ncbi:hypothetical protein R6Q59_012549 [Mikania micrantha]